MPLSAATDDATARIKIAFQQGVLVHSMSHAACFTMAGIDLSRNKTRAIEDFDTFTTALKGLREGHEWLRLAPETDPRLIAHVEDMQDTWRLYGPAVQQVLHKDYHSVVLQQIIDNGDMVFDASISLAHDIARQHAGEQLDPKLLAAITLAARHRMLSQRAIKEFCFVLVGLGGEQMPKRLNATLQEYDMLLQRLRSGDTEIAAPPNSRVERSFRTADLFWKKITPLFERAAAGEVPTEMEIAKALKMNASVMKQLIAASDAYLLGLQTASR